ncbi:Zn(II)2Cys6 transcription factor, partial [Candidatus Bathyarchaeota archaeon]|nr:Zn(II)2Cys6 transcription factor [Candidatus Bathyarchaeota archaeon]
MIYGPPIKPGLHQTVCPIRPPLQNAPVQPSVHTSSLPRPRPRVGMPDTPDDLVSRQQGRKRSKLACEPCRELKRKCDGSSPCATCLRFEYDCTFQGVTGKRKRAD